MGEVEAFAGMRRPSLKKLDAMLEQVASWGDRNPHRQIRPPWAFEVNDFSYAPARTAYFVNMDTPVTQSVLMSACLRELVSWCEIRAGRGLALRFGSRGPPLTTMLLPWAIFAGLILLLAIYFVGAEEGAMSLISGMYVHEFVHDGRHLLSFPCH